MLEKKIQIVNLNLGPELLINIQQRYSLILINVCTKTPV